MLNQNGQITKIEYANGDVTQYTYDVNNFRLVHLKTQNAQLQNIQDFYYVYDAFGNILTITDNVNTATQEFRYDELNRLVYANDSATYGEKTYSYDEIGNIIEKDNKTYTYGENDAGPHAVTSISDGTTFSYDANGNMTDKIRSGVITHYTYDSENRLIQVKKNGRIISEYKYDGDGGRTEKITYKYSGGGGKYKVREEVGGLVKYHSGRGNHLFNLRDIVDYTVDTFDNIMGVGIAEATTVTMTKTKFIGNLCEVTSGVHASETEYIYI